MVGQPAYFTNPNAFGPPQMSLAEQLAGQGFLSPGMQGPGEEMFYGFSPEAQSLMGGGGDRMYAGQSITPELLRYMAQSWGGGSMSPDQLKQAFPSYLHSYMPQFDPTTKVEYITEGHGMKSKGAQKQFQKDNPDWSPHYKYTYKNPIAAPKFQELPSIDIQQQMGLEAEQQLETEEAEWDRERRGLLRTGAGRNVFGAGRT